MPQGTASGSQCAGSGVGMNGTLRHHARQIWESALAAAQPETFMRTRLHWDGTSIRMGEAQFSLPEADRPVPVVAFGKAACSMVQSLERLLAGRPLNGVIITKEGHGQPVGGCRVFEAAHPLPDERGVTAARFLLRWIDGEIPPGSPVIVLISGGTSALLCLPARGISLMDKIETSRRLIAAGARIEELNCVRKHLSAIKGGRLAQALGDRPLFTLVLSDVIGDGPDIIGSGPTAPDASTFAGARQVLAAYRLESAVPGAVLRFLEEGAAGVHPETVRAEASLFRNKTIRILGNNRSACQAASARAAGLGYRPMLLSASLGGDTGECAGFHLAVAREILASGQPVPLPACLVSGGETVVTVRGSGRGGRNQEFVLHCIREIGRWETAAVVASLGTDGTDGPTEAAGAIADNLSLARAASLGLSPERHLEANDSNTFFHALDDLIVTGPTGTNVMDLRLLLIANQSEITPRML